MSMISYGQNALSKVDKSALFYLEIVDRLWAADAISVRWDVEAEKSRM
jgi:hypothetical protein